MLVFYGLASLLSPISLTGAVFIMGMALLGIGGGAIFQLVPQCFQTELGVATGLVGTFGGIGGFLIPIMMGYMNLSLNSYASGWVVLADFAFIAFIALRILVILDRNWRSSWAATRKASSFSPSMVSLTWVSFHSGW